MSAQEHVGLLSSDEGGGSSDERSDSSEDEVTEHVAACQPADMAAARAQVPTISVTAHSPGVLDDSLQQLRRLHAAVQRMRQAPTTALTTNLSRLSTSCPSLCKDAPQEPDCASPTHLDLAPASRKNSCSSRQWWWSGRECRDEARRSSWAALEPNNNNEHKRTRSALNGHSASLSSMESEGEGVPRPVRHSTHSLNDNDLAKEFEAVTLALRLGADKAEHSARAVGALHKSVSTPHIAPQTDHIVTNANFGRAESESPSEDESRHVAHARTRARLAHTHVSPTYDKAAFDPSEKRRKRGSLFFRKKKDKSRKAAHVWQAGGSGGGDCDWCSRPLTDKPALYCENCTMTVHQNVCKDYIVECNKPKSAKTSVTKSLSSSSGKANKRSSLANQAHATSTSHLLNEDKDGSDHRHDHSNASEEGCQCPEAALSADSLGADATRLNVAAPEPDTWAAAAAAHAKTLSDRETKRQEHIYELILTEKHHCLTIRLMQKMFAEGMLRVGGVTPSQVGRMFPGINELWRVHSALLGALRTRQRRAPIVNTIADILCDAFSYEQGELLKRIYGEFCSRHRDAVEVFKECCAREPRIARFINKCQQNPLLRKKGVPECVLFVAQRLTKYPLLIEPLLKTAADDAEKETLQKALRAVKEILVDVDNQVAAKEREDRKLEIYHRIDAKSFAYFRGTKFKKSDILQGNRSLKFEGVATMMQGRSKMQTLFVIVLTDVLFFLHDNNNKYTFFTPDNKTGVVSLVKLLVREKAGAEGKGLYLICSGAAEPEMFELRVHRPKDIQNWILNIRAAVQACPDEVEESESTALATSVEERQRQLEARHENIRLITEALRAKDREHAALLEEKMALHMKLVGHTAGSTVDFHNTGIVPGQFPGGLTFPDYIRLAAPPHSYATWQELCDVVKAALEVSAAGWAGWSASVSAALGRSTSCVRDRHSHNYVSPALPRRADTFAGFDNKVGASLRPQDANQTQPASAPREPEKSAEMRGGELCGEAALKLQHAVYTLTCIAWQQLTTIHSLEAQVCAWRAGVRVETRHDARHDAQLEELRHAQATVTHERAQLERERNKHHADLQHEREQLELARHELLEQQKDVEIQRERLYRRLERLQQHGDSQEEIASVGTLSPDSSVSESTRRKEPKWRSGRGSTGSEVSSGPGVLPPVQLLSARNETKATVRAPAYCMVKQQLPLKLASGGKSQSGNQAPPPLPPHGYSRLHDSPSDHSPGLVIHHTRTGSSPAPLPTQQQQTNNKATRTNTYPKLPDKFRLRSPSPPASQPPASMSHPFAHVSQSFAPVSQPLAQINQSSAQMSQSGAQNSQTATPAHSEEEVIYF